MLWWPSLGLDDYLLLPSVESTGMNAWSFGIPYRGTLRVPKADRETEHSVTANRSKFCTTSEISYR